MKLKNKKILETAHRYSNWAFCQGYEAAMQGIDKDDRVRLRQMPEAFERITEFQNLVNALEESGNNNDNI